MTEPAGIRIYAATGNRDKLREIRQILGAQNVVVLGRDDVAPYVEPEETGNTLTENALIKAREGFNRTGLPTLADDSGLEVEALGGAPGVYSSRYAGENATYADNVRKLLAEMESLPSESRSARFRCVMALVFAGSEQIREGSTEGFITIAPRGESGFGYDPVFYAPELNKTFAEADPDEKNRVSHRGRALQRLAEDFTTIMSQEIEPFAKNIP